MNSPIDLGFVGLGAMGFPMASNLIEKSPKGSRIFVYDVYEASMTRFAAKFPGSTIVCSSPAEVSRSAVSTPSLPTVTIHTNANRLRQDIVFTMLPEGSHVKSVYLNATTGILQDNMHSKTLVDCSTIDVETCMEVQETVHQKHPNASFYDAPVSGGTLGAEAGTITVMLGCSEDDLNFLVLKKLFSLMSKNIVPCGKPGMGLVAKLCNNYCSGLIALATAEAMNIGMRAGIEPRLLARVFSSSTAQSTISDKWNPVPGVCPEAPSSRGYQGGFKVQLMAKDFGLAFDVAEKVGARMLLGQAGRDAYRNASNDPKCRDLDSRVIFRYIGGHEEWTGKL
jgi:3-hydroxyisobutyrate dehydrogenase